MHCEVKPVEAGKCNLTGVDAERPSRHGLTEAYVTESQRTSPIQVHLCNRNKTRRLATANRSRISIHGRSCKILLTCSLIIMQNLVVGSDTVHHRLF